MKRPLAFAGGVVLSAGLLAVTLLASLPAGASSHREAPMIAGDPYADLTDVYAFVSSDKPDSVTLIMNAIPYGDAMGGPMPCMPRWRASKSARWLCGVG